MTWQKPAWRLYRTLAGVIAAVPGARKVLKKGRLGKQVDTVLRRFVVSRLPNPIDVHNLTIYWHHQSWPSMPKLAAGVYEPDTRAFIEQHLKPGMTVVDLGAHLGFFSLVAARCVGSLGRVYAFEPQPELYDLMLKNVEANGFQDIIRPVKKAVSNVQGSPVFIYLEAKDNREASFYRTPEVGSESIAVDVTTLDAFFAAEGWPPVHLIKMDIEGAEKLALEGMRELSARNPELNLIMEFNPGTQLAADVAPEELFKTLEGLGFNKFSALKDSVLPLTIPQDIPRLIRMAGDGSVNLLCER